MSSSSRGERRRAAILEAATELFLAQGYEGTSLDMIIEAAGGSRRSVYTHFGNKQGLFVAAIEALFARTAGSLAALECAEMPVEDALITAGEQLLQILLEPRVVAAFRVVIAELRRTPKIGELLFHQGPGDAYASFAAFLRARSEAGELCIDDPEHAATQLVELIKGELHLRALLGVSERPSKDARRRQVEAAVATFLRGAPRSRARAASARHR